MESELKAMREEIAKLRERVAVLEGKPAAWQYNPTGPSLLEQCRDGKPFTVGTPSFVPGTGIAITC